VEVTKLSLLLKLMEGEKQEFFGYLFNVDNAFRLLPDLTSNIKCGNSLIGSDILTNQESLIDNDTLKSINPFDWNEEFKDIISNGGFDCVIGNPPYVQLQKESGKLGNMFKNQGYETFERTGDIYALFYEKGIKLLKKGAYLTYITSNKWMRARYGKSLRQFFLKHNPMILIDLGAGVFQNATVDTNIIMIQNETNKNQLRAISLSKLKTNELNFDTLLESNSVTLSNLTENEWFIGNQAEIELKAKIEKIGKPLKDWNVNINYGIKIGFNEAFIIDTETKERLCKEDPKSAEVIKPVLRGRDIKRYSYEWAGLWLINSHNGIKEKGIPPINIPKDYPAIYNHLKQYKTELEKRQDKGDHWTNLRNCAYIEEFEKEKIVYPETTVRRSEFCLDRSKMMFCDKTCFIIVGDNIIYINSIMASKLIEWFLENALRLLNKKSIQYSKQYVENTPIPPITDANSSLVNKIETLVDEMLSTQKLLHSSKTEADKKLYQTKANAIDKKIDEIVYKLYGLTDEEIKIVEESIK